MEIINGIGNLYKDKFQFYLNPVLFCKHRQQIFYLFPDSIYPFLWNVPFYTAPPPDQVYMYAKGIPQSNKRILTAYTCMYLLLNKNIYFMFSVSFFRVRMYHLQMFLTPGCLRKKLTIPRKETLHLAMELDRSDFKSEIFGHPFCQVLTESIFSSEWSISVLLVVTGQGATKKKKKKWPWA